MVYFFAFFHPEYVGGAEPTPPTALIIFCFEIFLVILLIDLGEDEMTGNFPRWKFKDADELLSSPMFDGRSIKDFLPEVKGWEPGC